MVNSSSCHPSNVYLLGKRSLGELAVADLSRFFLCHQKVAAGSMARSPIDFGWTLRLFRVFWCSPMVVRCCKQLKIYTYNFFTVRFSFQIFCHTLSFWVVLFICHTVSFNMVRTVFLMMNDWFFRQWLEIYPCQSLFMLMFFFWTLDLSLRPIYYI